MSKSLSSHNEDTPIETAQFIAKIQTHMLETVKTNFKEAYKPNFVCKSCNLGECKQSHLLYCSKLIGSNQLVSYIPEYQDIFNDDDPKEQCYIARLMMENLQKKKTNRRQYLMYYNPCAPVSSVLLFLQLWI